MGVAAITIYLPYVGEGVFSYIYNVYKNQTIRSFLIFSSNLYISLHGITTKKKTIRFYIITILSISIIFFGVIYRYALLHNELYFSNILIFILMLNAIFRCIVNIGKNITHFVMFYQPLVLTRGLGPELIDGAINAAKQHYRNRLLKQPLPPLPNFDEERVKQSFYKSDKFVSRGMLALTGCLVLIGGWNIYEQREARLDRLEERGRQRLNAGEITKADFYQNYRRK